MRPLHPVVRFTLICSGLVLGALLAMWGALGFTAFGMGANGVAAMVLGSVLSVALASALMGLLFHSERTRGHGDGPWR